MNEDRSELPQVWPEQLDAMIAAPDHHQVLLENDRVRVLDSRVRSGDETPVHTHRWPAVLYILGTSDFVRCDPDGNVIYSSLEAGVTSFEGQTTWSPPLTPHFVKNVGETEIRVISIEVKD